MAQRTLDSSFWDDEDIARLTRDERLLLICMFTDASLSDDFGCLQANPKTLKKHAFGYDDDVTSEQVRIWRDAILAKCKNVLLYVVEGQEYIWLKKFQQWQKLRFHRKSNIPEPSETNLVEHKEITENCSNLPKSDGNFPLCSVALNRVEQDSVELGCAEPPQPLPPQTNPRPSSRIREPVPINAALQAYFDVMQVRPNREQAVVITATITPSTIVKWKDVLRAWKLHDYKPGNVPGMLEWYAHGIPTNGNGKSRAAPVATEMSGEEMIRLNHLGRESEYEAFSKEGET